MERFSVFLDFLYELFYSLNYLYNRELPTLLYSFIFATIVFDCSLSQLELPTSESIRIPLIKCISFALIFLVDCVVKTTNKKKEIGN